MKAYCVSLLQLGLALLVTGCSSKNVISQRGWVGGKFQLAKRGDASASDGRDSRVPAFPPQLNEPPKAGIFVEAVYTNTPLALAGIHEGDLILQVNHKPVGKMKAIRKAIDNSRPGSTVSMAVFRDGHVEDHIVTVGCETFKESRYFAMGLAVSTKLELDLFPNPDFTLIALGYSHDDRRIELKSPQMEFTRQIQTQDQAEPDTEAGMASYESWKAWLALFSLGGRKTILSQETVEPAHVSALKP